MSAGRLVIASGLKARVAIRRLRERAAGLLRGFHPLAMTVAGPVRRTALPPYRLTAGFTLVEVLVSLVVASIAALLAHGLFSAAVTGSAELRAARGSVDRAANTRRFLGAAFLSLQVGTEGAGAFVGQTDGMQFAAWLETADGWLERRDIVLSLREGRLLAGVSSEPAIVLGDSVAAVGFDYLLEPGAESRWVGEWMSPVSAPLAVRLRITRYSAAERAVTDTTIYLIKARG